MSYFDVLDRIKPTGMQGHLREDILTADGPFPNVERQEASALVVDAGNRTVVTVPAEVPKEEAALDPDSFLTRLRGRLVGAEQANRNGQFWTTGDLVFGVGTVAGGPLNWLHQERRIVGALTEARLVEGGKQTAAEGWSLPHIEAEASMWSFLFPSETHIVREAAAMGKLFYSMECVSKNVECYGPNGCGNVVSYADATLRTERACEHIRAKASARRLINPVFQGAAIIVPPVQPGWANANVELVRKAGSNDKAMAFTDGDEALAAQILAFIQGPTSA